MTFHAAYEPQRAVRTDRWKYIRRFHDYEQPVLANCDDSATKELLIENGWGEQFVPEEQLYDLVLDPNESRDLLGDPAHAETLADLRARLEAWMERDRRPAPARPDRAAGGRDRQPPGAALARRAAPGRVDAGSGEPRQVTSR